MFTGNNADINTLSAGDDLINPDYDRLLNGDGMELSGKTRTFSEAQWNGRIETKLHLGGISYVYINVDPRENLFGDDIIIEYRSFYKSGSKEINQKLNVFHGSIDFHWTDNDKVNVKIYKDMDSQAGFTRNSGKANINKLRIKIEVESLSGVKRTAYFNFA